MENPVNSMKPLTYFRKGNIEPSRTLTGAEGATTIETITNKKYVGEQGSRVGNSVSEVRGIL